MKYNFFLDASRGILCWTVVWVHIVFLSGYIHSGTRAQVGWWAVEAFMAISGYLAISTYRKESYLRYLSRRFFRLIPVLLVSWSLSRLVGTTLVPGWFIWPLAQFYLIFPGIIWAINRYGRAIVLLWLVFFSFFFMLPVIYDFLKHFAPMGQLLPMCLLWFVSGICAFYVIDAQVLEELSEKASKYRFLIVLGDLSYSTYLIHWPVLFGLSRIIPDAWPNLARMALIAFPGLPLIGLASVILNRWVELPGIRLGKNLESRAPRGSSVREVA